MAGLSTSVNQFFTLTLAKSRYIATRRRRAPGSTYGLHADCPRERPSNPGDESPADLFLSPLHGMTLCAARNVWRLAPLRFPIPSSTCGAITGMLESSPSCAMPVCAARSYQ